MIVGVPDAVLDVVETDCFAATCSTAAQAEPHGIICLETQGLPKRTPRAKEMRCPNGKTGRKRHLRACEDRTPSRSALLRSARSEDVSGEGEGTRMKSNETIVPWKAEMASVPPTLRAIDSCP